MNWVLVTAIVGGLAWIGLGYIQFDVHHYGRQLTQSKTILLYAAEFVAAVTCLMSLARLWMNATGVNG